MPIILRNTLDIQSSTPMHTFFILHEALQWGKVKKMRELRYRIHSEIGYRRSKKKNQEGRGKTRGTSG